MELATAVRVFTDLEKPRYEYEDALYPRYDVRFDANSDGEEARYYRLFIRHTAGVASEEAEQDWRYVLDLAQEHNLVVCIEDSGIELT